MSNEIGKDNEFHMEIHLKIKRILSKGGYVQREHTHENYFY